MIFIKNRADLKKNYAQIPDEIIPLIENDLKIIEEGYPKYDDKFIMQFGPVIVLLDRSERTNLKKKMPVIKQLVTEYVELVFNKDNTKIKKKLYILTESGILLYERYQSWGNV